MDKAFRRVLGDSVHKSSMIETADEMAHIAPGGGAGEEEEEESLFES